ncbi:hypothetical protein M569_06031, partial [Genlisea aurea]
FRCCSDGESRTPPLLKSAVGVATQLLSQFFSGAGRVAADEEVIPVSSVDDVVSIIRSDYRRNYFVTGRFTASIYADDCRFEDPTIGFEGKDLYSRNLNLLVPFLENASIELKTVKKGNDSAGEEFIECSWKLTTHLRFPWKPLICIDGRTVYSLDEELRVVKHVEYWNKSAIDAIIQIFIPG